MTSHPGSVAGTPVERNIAVTVVIPVKDDARRLALCLDALAEQDFGAPFEVVVIDNGSSDDVPGVVAGRPNVRLLFEPIPSSYAARNTGLSAARGQVLAFTDSDCVPDPAWLKRGYPLAAQLGVRGFVGGRVRVFPQDPDHPTASELFEMAQAFQQRWTMETHGCSVTANIVVDRRVIEVVGQFDSQLVSGGDIEWCRRAGRAGMKALYADNVIVAHPARRSFSELATKGRRIEQGNAQKRAVAGQPLQMSSIIRALVPPIRGVSSHLSAMPPPRARSMAKYVGVAFALHYIRLWHRLRFERRLGALD